MYFLIMVIFLLAYQRVYTDDDGGIIGFAVAKVVSNYPWEKTTYPHLDLMEDYHVSQPVWGKIC